MTDATGYLTSDAMRVMPGRLYSIEVGSKISAGASTAWYTVSATLRWYGSTGSQIGSDLTGLASRTVQVAETAAFVAAAFAQAPAGAVTARVEVVVFHDYRGTFSETQAARITSVSMREGPTAERWFDVGVDVAFSNSWVNYGSPFQAARYRKRADGVVELQGLIKSGTLGSAAFTLPAGYRPAATLLFAVSTNTTSGTGRCDVATSGAVTPHATLAANGYVSLSGISFLAEA